MSTDTAPIAVAVNTISSKVYVANSVSNNVTVVTPAPSNAIPLNTSITPFPDNTTKNRNVTLNLSATSTYFPTVPQPRNIYFQMNTTNGTWSRALNTGNTATTLNANAILSGLRPGLHTLYFFATDGTNATSINPLGEESTKATKLSPESSPIIGGINAYTFLSKPTTQFDFDGDGKTDVAIFRPVGGGGSSEWWWVNSGNSSNSALQFGTATDLIAPGDFTGDGKMDITLFRPSDGNWYVLRSDDFSYYSFPFGAAGDRPVTGGYDGDGKADPAVFRPSAGQWFIQRSSDNQVQIIPFGIPGDVPVTADYDGDGKDDVGIYRRDGANGGEWWINRSTAGLIALTFGTSTDLTVPGDYTGDGKADIAFFRPSNGTWFVLRSEDLSFFSFPFGTTGDVPSPGDYDGDGKIDAAVFRPSSATWFIQGSTSGTTIQQFGSTGDVPVPNAFVR